MTYLATGFRDADAEADVGKLVDCLEFLDDLPCFRAYKERSIDALCLTKAARAIDLCCGLGHDLLRMRRRAAHAEVVGLDRSGSLLSVAGKELANERGITLVEGDARETGFPGGHFDAVRVDRSLQHIERPQEVVAEMARILKRGGRAVVCEPDWDTFRVTSSHEEEFEKAAAFWRGSFANPRAGWRAAGQLTREGMEVFLVEANLVLARSFEEADKVFDVRSTLGRCVANRILEKDVAAEIVRDMERLSGDLDDLHGRLAQTVSGAKPPGAPWSRAGFAAASRRATVSVGPPLSARPAAAPGLPGGTAMAGDKIR
jgi:ubiquinone/menaquinone biosynthesis C-methylase UbiE